MDDEPILDLTISRGRRHARRLLNQAPIQRGIPLFGAVSARREQGELPVVMPRIILQAPLWTTHHAARRNQGVRFTWVQPDTAQRDAMVEWVVETMNPLDHAARDEAQRIGDPYGRLQFFDLDLLFSLSLEWFRRDCRTTHITVDQTTVLTWLGYKAVHDPPYATLRASIRRMAWTNIAWYRVGEREDAKALDLLGKESSWEMGSRARPGEIVAELSSTWLKQIFDPEADRQIIDLARYFHLVRYLRAHPRTPDLARSVYTFLGSLARDGESVAKTDWLIERFAQRQVRPNGKVYLRYSDPLRRGHLADALQALYESRVAEHIRIEGDKIEVHWNSAREMSALPSSDRQERFIGTSLRDGSEVLVLGHEAAVPPNLAGASLEEVVQELRQRCSVSQAHEQDARSRGWQTGHLAMAYAAALLAHQGGEIDDPGDAVAGALNADWSGWSVERIESEDPVLYERLFGTDGLLAPIAATIRAAIRGPTHPEPGTAAEAWREDPRLARLLELVPVPARVLTTAAERWSPARIGRVLLVAVYQKEQGEVAKPAAWAASVLRRGEPEEWSSAALEERGPVGLVELQRWAEQAGGPLAGIGRATALRPRRPSPARPEPEPAPEAAPPAPPSPTIAEPALPSDQPDLEDLLAEAAPRLVEYLDGASEAVARDLDAMIDAIATCLASEAPDFRALRGPAARLLGKQHGTDVRRLGASVLAAVGRR